MEDTTPIAPQAPGELTARKVDGWKILRCVSTAVSVATIATLVWTVNKVSDDETPAERMTAAAGATMPAVLPSPPAPRAEPAEPAPVAQSNAVAPSGPSAPVTPTADIGVRTSPWEQYFPATGPSTPAGGLPPINFASLPAPNIMVNPGFSIDAIIGAVTGTAGWVGGGTLNLLGDAIAASAMNNQRPADPLTALAAPLTKIPPPQWPRELDVTKIPPPHVHWDRLLPKF